MKKRILFWVTPVLLMSISCAKDRTCECTSISTSTSTNSSGVTTTNTGDPQVTTTVYKKAKKSDLGFLCGDTKNDNSQTNSNGSSSSSTETKCVIK